MERRGVHIARARARARSGSTDAGCPAGLNRKLFPRDNRGVRVLRTRRGPGPRPSGRALWSAMHSLCLGAFVLAASGIACVATSASGQPGEEFDDASSGEADDGDGIGMAFTAGVFFNNATDDIVELRVRPLMEGIAVDCARVAEDAGGLLAAAHFGEPSIWRVPPDSNLPLGAQSLDDTGSGEALRACDAVLLETEGTEPTLVFWPNADFPAHRIPGRLARDAALPSGAVRLTSNADDSTRELQAQPSYLVAALHDLPRDPVAECNVPWGAAGIGWSRPVPWGRHTVAAAELGPDGCWALQLDPVNEGTLGEEGSLDGDAARWYLCLARREVLEFAAGADLVLQPGAGGEGSAIVKLLHTPAAMSSVGQAARELWVGHGAQLEDLPLAEAAIIDESDCEYAIEARCATTRRPVALAALNATGAATQLRPGDAAALLRTTSGGLVEFDLVHATRAIVVDGACDAGRKSVGIHVEFLAAQDLSE